MQFEGSSKRKRKSSECVGNIENSLVCDTKRLRVRENDGDLCEDTDNLATDERLPLAELPVGQPLDESDVSDTEWVEKCLEEFIDEEDGEEDEPGCDGRGNEEGIILDENGAPLSPDVDLEEAETCAEPSGSSLYHSSTQFTSKIDLMNFFKRKGRTGSEDRGDTLFVGNPSLQPKMRSVLLEWIAEVCEVYKLYRETYHLAVDYLDRYLCHSENILKGQLQLIGVTALFIAAKYEEIYPPKMSDFSYITDGACTDEDIITMEGLIVQALEWRFTVTTSNSWVLGFLQLMCVQDKTDCGNTDVSVPWYNHRLYETIMHLLDLCSLDSGFAKYPYKVLALSSIYRVIPNPDSIILKVSGYTFEDLIDCMDWMLPFWSVLCQKFHYESVADKILKSSEFTARLNDFTHMRMKHNIDLEILEVVNEMKEKTEEIPELLLTPPSSSKKGDSTKTPGQVDTA